MTDPLSEKCITSHQLICKKTVVVEETRVGVWSYQTYSLSSQNLHSCELAASPHKALFSKVSCTLEFILFSMGLYEGLSKLIKVLIFRLKSMCLCVFPTGKWENKTCIFLSISTCFKTLKEKLNIRSNNILDCKWSWMGNRFSSL